ncbi:MAG: hypothetical protein PVI23_04465 [Maricaulaceae bacterium]|jgi:hypothetical protein
MYVRLFSAIIAGSIFLSLQPEIGDRADTFAMLSNTAVVLSVLATAVAIFDSARSRFGYRRRMTELGGLNDDGTPRIAPPKLVRVNMLEAVRILVIVASGIVFVCFNPFAI